MVMQWPWLRCMQLSASKKSCSLSVPARTCSLMLHTPVPEPSSWPRHLPLSIGPPETPMVGRSTLAAPISSDGVVLSQPMSSTTPSIGLPRIDLLDVHAGEVAVQHRGGPQQRLAQRHHRELEREAAGLVDADLHLLGERAEVRVAGRELAEGVADADDRAAVELVVRDALALDPAAVGEAVAVLAAEPLPAAQLLAGLLAVPRVSWATHSLTAPVRPDT